MVFLILFTISIFFVLVSKDLFKTWFNHLSIYIVIWFVLITLYEMKLLQYENLRLETWFIIGGAFLSYYLGIITYFTAKNELRYYPDTTSEIYGKNKILFDNNGIVLKIGIVVTSLIGLAGAVQNWMVLFHKFKTIQNIIISANVIYQMRVAGDLEFLPYFSSFSFVAVFLGSIYTAWKRKFSFYILIPFLAVVLSELANVGRAGMLFAFVEFISVMILYRPAVLKIELTSRKWKKLKNIISIVFISVLLIAGATSVKLVRSTIESYSGASSSLNEIRGGLVISPSIYFYFSGDLGVLNKYLELDKESNMFGENTFMPVYRVLNKFGIVKKPHFYQIGYFVPVWMNTGTYLRELHADFGISGILIIPYFLGLFTTFLWFKFRETLNLKYFILLVYFYIIIFFSFLMFEPRLGYWTISLVLLLIITPFMEKISRLLLNRKEDNAELDN